MMRGTLMGDVVSEAQRLAPGQRTIVFAATREHGKALAARFAEAGRTTEYLDGQTYSDVRQAMVGAGGRFDRGETEVVVNVDVLSEGYDCPGCEVHRDGAADEESHEVLAVCGSRCAPLRTPASSHPRPCGQLLAVRAAQR